VTVESVVEIGRFPVPEVRLEDRQDKVKENCRIDGAASEGAPSKSQIGKGQ